MTKSISKLTDLVHGLEFAIYKATGNIERVAEKRENSLTRTLAVEWKKNLARLDAQIAKTFTGDKQPTKNDYDSVARLCDSLFIDFAEPLDKDIERDISLMYRLNKADFVNRQMVRPIEKAKKKSNVEIIPAFTDADKKTIKILKDQNKIAANAFYKGNLSKEVSQILANTYKEGKNMTNAGKALRDRLSGRLGLSKKVIDQKIVPSGYTGSSASYFKGLASTSMNRARTFSSLTAMVDAGFTEYRIFNPLPVNDTCIQMNGRVFRIDQGVSQMKAVLGAKDVDALKKVAPWQRDLSSFGIKGAGQKMNSKTSKTLADAGLALPPYHFRCKTTVEVVASSPGGVEVIPDETLPKGMNAALDSADDIVIGEKYLFKNQEVTVTKRFVVPSKGNIDVVGYTTSEGKFKTTQVHIFKKKANRLGSVVEPEPPIVAPPIPKPPGGTTIPVQPVDVPRPKPVKKPRKPRATTKPDETIPTRYDDLPRGVPFTSQKEAEAFAKMINEATSASDFKKLVNKRYNVRLYLDDSSGDNIRRAKDWMMQVALDKRLSKIMMSDSVNLLDLGGKFKYAEKYYRRNKNVLGFYSQNFTHDRLLSVRNLRSTGWDTLVHELGHAFDHYIRNGGPKVTGRFTIMSLQGPWYMVDRKMAHVWGNRRFGYITWYAETDPCEDFAEVMKFYWKNKERLMRVAPEKLAELERLFGVWLD